MCVESLKASIIKLTRHSVSESETLKSISSENTKGHPYKVAAASVFIASLILDYSDLTFAWTKSLVDALLLLAKFIKLVIDSYILLKTDCCRTIGHSDNDTLKFS
jgi:hypothetical protein